MSTNKTILGFLGGVAAGAALGILFAPQSGKKTRRAIMRRGEQAKDDLTDLIEEGHEQWRKARNKAADAVSMTKAEVEDFVRYLMKEGKGFKDRVTDEVKSSADNKRSAEDLRKASAN